VTALFWASIAIIAYTFAGYPALLALWARMRPRRWQREAIAPSISIVISAYNEAETITAKIANLLALDYPADRIEILIGSDGSNDDTSAVLATVTDVRVRAFLYAQRRGKPAVLNALVPEAKGDIVVLADVRQQFDTNALRALVQSFADRAVGAVTGELLLRTDGAATVTGKGSGMYWTYEKFIRSREALTGSTVVVTGAIYAVRKHVFTPIPEDTICDDLLIPLMIARRGYRVVFERDARAYDVTPARADREFSRKVRTVAGAYQLFARERWLFNPLENRVWFQTMSHKALRLTIAPLQLAALAANVALIAIPFYRSMLFAQALFYAGAITGCVLPRTWKKPVVVAVPWIFCMLSWATVRGFHGWLTGRQRVTWKKTESTLAGHQVGIENPS
jgi:biofilm PGA synthesis N-glycosyltransferase PgaC